MKSKTIPDHPLVQYVPSDAIKKKPIMTPTSDIKGEILQLPSNLENFWATPGV